MIIKPKLKPKKNKNSSLKYLYCCRCGSKVKFCKKYLTQFCQTKMFKRNIWNVFISYACPDCVQVNSINLIYNRSLDKEIRKINLYGLY